MSVGKKLKFLILRFLDQSILPGMAIRIRNPPVFYQGGEGNVTFSVKKNLGKQYQAQF